jgi:cytosine deaminase
MADLIDPKQIVLDKIKVKGGWVNAHAHVDRAFIIDEENFKLTNDTLQEKWAYPDKYKSAATVETIYANMTRVADELLAQGGQALACYIDVDPVIEDRAIQAAEQLKTSHGQKLQLKFINQVVKGVTDLEARKWFETGAEFADFIGGLPEKDAGREAEHFDILFEAAKKNGGKPLHVHVDQFNSPDQRDTELLVNKTIEHGYEGKVVAIHCISVGAQPRQYRQELYKKMKDAGIMVVACPTAWIDNSWIDTQDADVIGPIHNAVTPVKEMLAAGITIAIGSDDIQDIYKPFTDGDMWTELRFLLEAQRLYDLDILAEIATVNGRKALFLE